MTLTVKVSAELEHKIKAAAQQSGVTIDEFVRTVIDERFDSQSSEQRHKATFTAKVIAAGLPVRDRSKEYEWLAANRDNYAGKYVALDADKLVAVGDNAKEAAERARSLGVKGALISFVEGSSREPFISGGV